MVAHVEHLETRRLLTGGTIECSKVIPPTLPMTGTLLGTSALDAHAFLKSSASNGGTSTTPTPHQSGQNPPPQTHLNIVATFDSSITSDPNSAAIEKAINSIIAEYNAAFSDPFTINISFQSMTSGLGQSQSNGDTIPYSQFLTALTNSASTGNDTAALANLPKNATTDPVLGQASIDINTANEKALGISPSITNNDGTIGINTSICNLDRVNIDPNKYDLEAVAAHEIDEVLGFGSNIGGSDGFVMPQDLFRYDQTGKRSFSTNTNSLAYFSLDTKTHITQFNQDGQGDYGDWASGSVDHVQDAYGTPGVVTDPNVEFIGLDVQGYHYLSSTSSAPVITKNPVNLTVAVGQTATFTAAATGDPTPAVQWQVSTDGGNTFSNISGATSTTYSLITATIDNNHEYQAVFTNSQGSATTSAATLTVTSKLAVPVVTTNPTSQSIADGQQVAFTAAASGNPTPTVQWQVSTDSGKTFTNVFGAKSATFSFTVAAADSGKEYQAVFTNSQGTATTKAATLTVLTAPVVTTNPLNQQVAAGQKVSFTAAASGNPTPTVQWEVSTDGGSTFTKISGATSTTLSFTVATTDDNNEYQASFTNSQGVAITKAAILTVANTSPPVITTNPVSQRIVSGQGVTFTAAATGNPAPGVQWQVSTDGGKTFANITGATSTTYRFQVTSGQNGNQYQAVFTNSQGKAITPPATLTVTSLTAPTITTNPSSQSIPVGQQVTFSASAKGSPTPNAQWQVSTDSGKTFTNISGATANTYTFTVTTAQNGFEYQVIFTNPVGKATTTAATLTALSAPAVTTNPIIQTVTNGQSVSFTAAATGSPTPSVQWQVSTDSGRSFANILGATSRTYTFVATSADDSHRYQAVFTNSQGKATTTAATLNVITLTAPVVTSNPINQSIVQGQNVSFIATASGTPTPSIQWQVSTDGGKTFANILGATSTTLKFQTIASENGYEYRAIFTNSKGKATTKPATLTVLTAPTVTANPTSQSVKAAQQVTFTASASGNPAPTVQWQVSTNSGKSFANISGANSTTLTFTATATQNGYEYQAVFTNSQGKATTKPAILTLLMIPVVTIQPKSQTVTAGQTVTFTAAANGNPTPTVQWQVSTDGGKTYKNISGATSTKLSFLATAAQNGYKYQAVFTNSLGKVTTLAAVLTVKPT